MPTLSLDSPQPARASPGRFSADCSSIEEGAAAPGQRPAASDFLGQLQQFLAGQAPLTSDAAVAAEPVQHDLPPPAVLGSPAQAAGSQTLAPTGKGSVAAAPPANGKRTAVKDDAAPLDPSPGLSPTPTSPPIAIVIAPTDTPKTLGEPVLSTRSGPQPDATGGSVTSQTNTVAAASLDPAPSDAARSATKPSAPAANPGTPVAPTNEFSNASALRPASPNASAQQGSPEPRRNKAVAAEPDVAPAAPTETAHGAPSAPPQSPAPQSPASHPATAALAVAGPAGLTIAASTPILASSPPPPAVQVAKAIAEPVRILLAAPAQQSNAPHVTTIQLDPAELGRVEIRIERTGDGPAKVELAAQRPETLLRLVHDQPQLQQALDQAGIPQHGRTITFSLAPDGGASSFASFAGGGHANGNGQRSPPNFGVPNDITAETIETTSTSPARNRAGLNITA